VSYVLIGSSSVEPGSTLAALFATRLPGCAVTGIRGSSVSSWARERPRYPGQVVFVYLPGQQRAATVAEVQALDAALRQGGAVDVVWIPPPIFPSATREAVTGGTFRAIAAAGVRVAMPGRFELARSGVGADGVHLTREGATAFGEWLFARPSLAGIQAAAAIVGLAAWLLFR
jgi:hypothetical protein